MFLLALEIEFKRVLYLHDEGYDTDANYDLPQPLKKTIHIYVGTAVAKTSFDPTGYQEAGMPSLMSTPRGRPAEPLLHWMACKHLNFGNPHIPEVDHNDKKKGIISLQHPRMTWYGLRNLYWKGIYAYTWLWEDQRLVTLCKYSPTTGTCIQTYNHNADA